MLKKYVLLRVKIGFGFICIFYFGYLEEVLVRFSSFCRLDLYSCGVWLNKGEVDRDRFVIVFSVFRVVRLEIVLCICYIRDSF